MEIKTQFGVKEKAWIIHDFKAKEVEVHSIKIDVENSGEVKTTYFVNTGTKEIFDCAVANEKGMFLTREALISSL